ncbi:unnamed protein product, partial [Cladocopium goreaui]
EAGSCFVEKGSIYGAAILMPQLARSMNWHRLLTIEAFRSFILIAVSIFLQVSLLVMLARKESVYDTFAGQMFLCDLGAGCIQGYSSRCTGPSGTEITPPRLYSFDIWTTRLFVRAPWQSVQGKTMESLKAIFPDKQDDIDERIVPWHEQFDERTFDEIKSKGTQRVQMPHELDPGEYGLESYYCRLLCLSTALAGQG